MLSKNALLTIRAMLTQTSVNLYQQNADASYQQLMLLRNEVEVELAKLAAEEKPAS